MFTFYFIQLFYGMITFYLAAFFVSRDEELDFSQVKFGAGMIAAVNTLLLFLWICLPHLSPFLWLAIFVVTVFFVYALEVGMIVKRAVIATILFTVMFLPGLYGIMYFLRFLSRV